ncbi:hypothetical protein FRC08_007237 [Ceratobasidium sp. 394]|nr:hypothetical protein FRC08_007237 [Ceratobasidium sp. 394]
MAPIPGPSTRPVDKEPMMELFGELDELRHMYSSDSSVFPLLTQSNATLPPTAPLSTSASHRNLPSLTDPKISLRSNLTPTLRDLCSTCDQQEPICFRNFVSTFSLDHAHTGYPPPTPQWKKIGEASYSEVFRIGGVVMKVIPLRMSGEGVEQDLDGPDKSEIKDVEKEIRMTRAMGEMNLGFIKLVRAHVARGTYPSKLLKLWDEYNKEFNSESVRPDTFPPSQLYALLILPYRGPDLEHYRFAKDTAWCTAASIFWQIARALGAAEDMIRFEHRDLHWGQVLIQDFPSADWTPTPREPVRVTLIDLGLSRMDALPGPPQYTKPEPDIFKGGEDYQFVIYQMMREHCLKQDGGWADYRPLTNVMWLHYLVGKLLEAKDLPNVSTRRAKLRQDGDPELAAFMALQRIQQELGLAIFKLGGRGVTRVDKRVFANCLKLGDITDGKLLSDASSVVAWGVGEGWISGHI